MKKYCLNCIAVMLCIIFLSGCVRNTNNTKQPLNENSADVSYDISQDSDPDISSEIIIPESSQQRIPKKATAEDLAKIQDYDTKYFVKKLTPEQKYRFVELYSGAMNFNESVVFDTPTTDDELTLLMILLNYDCPELIQITGDYFPEYGPDDEVTGLKFSYCMDEKEYESALKKLDTFIEIMKQKAEGKTEYEKEKMVYDTIFTTTAYLEDDKHSGSIYGTLCKHSARCEGFSKSFEWVMRNLGFTCMAVIGTQEWNVTSIFLNHSWNIVNIDGDYYNVDLTSDNTTWTSDHCNPPNYGFLNTNDDMTMHQRHIDPKLLEIGVPVCKEQKLNYHIQNGLYLREGEGTKENMIKLFRSHDSAEGIKELSIKYESYDEYLKANDYAREAIDEYTSKETTTNYQYIIYFNSLSRTLLFDKAVTEGG